MNTALRSPLVRLVTVVALTVAPLSACGGSGGSGGGDASATASDPGSAASSETPGGDTSPEPGDSASSTGGEGAPSTGSGAFLPAGETASTTSARIISVSNADGEITPGAVPLDTPAALREFVAPFGADLGPRVRAAVRDTAVPPDQTLMGAVVFVGCEKPTGIEVTHAFEGYEVTAVVPKSGSVQCLVAVTSVALFLVENP